MELNKIIQGDCVDVMKTMDENSIDTIITDPPAGISFMGKSWDSNKGGRDEWIEWLTEVMRECYRVAKPGSTALVWAIPRTSHWTATAMENAGWQIKDIIMHIFGSGFPKSTDISKQLDKGHERKVVGRNPNSRENCDKSNTLYESGTVGKTDNITEPATPEAKLWNGWGTALKPAAEHWIVAQKPNEGTYANNALKWGVSGLNIDGGRIGTEEITTNGKGKQDGNTPIVPQSPNYKGETHTGRFPANILLDEEAGKMLDEQSGVLKSGSKPGHKGKSLIGDTGGKTKTQGIINAYGDKGGASRFFYVAKASKSERNLGCEGLDKKQTVGGGGGIGDYKDDVNSCSGKYGSEKAPAKNNHPTVKPIKLMEYLCTLTKTPTGGIVLDPFAGSGTTCMAAKKTGRDFIGIEREESYVAIARARIKAVPLTLF